MRILLLALMFAAVLASATLVSTDPEASAQEVVYTVLVRKMVGGGIPDSDWTIHLNARYPSRYTSLGNTLTGYYDYTYFTFAIDKSGGQTLIEITDTLAETYRPIALHIRELLKTSYDPNIRVYTSGFSPGPYYTFDFMMLDLTFSSDQTLIVEFSNQYLPPHPPAKPNPVGGVVMPVNKFAVVVMYLALTGLVASLSTVYLIKRKQKP